MHRSGTSAATEVLARMGLHPPDREDRYPVTQWNEHGNWESRSLTSFNESLLHELGGSWSAPPALDPGWASADALADRRAEGARLFARAYPRRPVAWKDPRLCVVLPFWQRVVDPPRAALFVYRDPLEVAGSLAARNGLPELHGLALWERYVRAACAGLSGLPVLATNDRRLVDEASTWGHELLEFLDSIGLAIPGTAGGDLLGSVDPAMRHQRSTSADRAGPARDCLDLFDRLGALDGAHRPWESLDLGTEPAWVSEVLDLAGATQRTRRALRTARSSPAYRLAGWVRRGRSRP